MGINTVPQPPYSPEIAPCDFCLFPKLRGCRYETIEEMKEAVTKVIDTLTQEDFDGAFQKLLERYNKCIATGGDYFKEDKSFMCLLSIKVPIRKKPGNLFNDPRIFCQRYILNAKTHVLSSVFSFSGPFFETFPWSHLRRDAEYLTRVSAQVFIHLSEFLQQILVSKTFLVLLTYFFLTFFYRNRLGL